ncbi:hypothetical protein HQO26_17160 [Rhodococcus fascians]|nr:hypothetical protein [Rhodococcus fascians]MBY4418849.1 hypothetical protein [Rhodococcus fascians]
MVANAPQTVCFRASDDERALVQRVADHHGTNMSAFVREMMLSICERYIRDVGEEKFAADIADIETERERKRVEKEQRAAAAAERQKAREEQAERSKNLVASIALQSTTRQNH